MKGNMVHDFSRVPPPTIERSVFNRIHSYKTTLDSGWLVPVYLDETYPGDTYNLTIQSFIRMMSPLKTPIMDNLYCDFHFFFCPNRIIWEKWKEFMGENNNPLQSPIEWEVPNFDSAAFVVTSGSLADYFGLPIGVDIGGDPTPPAVARHVNALPFRAYNKIYNCWYKDENLIDNAQENYLSNANDIIDHYELRKRGKRHDYFTSALPWPQKSDAVNIPLAGNAPVYGDGRSLWLTVDPSSEEVGDTTGLQIDTVPNGHIWAIDPDNVHQALPHWGGGPEAAHGDSALGVVTKAQSAALNFGDATPVGLLADLSETSAITVNALRQAIALQRFFERDARGGTRYTEMVLAHFGVRSPDMRQQRPEFLGGFSFMLNVNPIYQTVHPAGTTEYVGQQYAHVTGADRGHVSYSATEHGWVMGIMSIRADLTYQQCMHRSWNRRQRTDYYFPAFAHLGEQAVLNKEVIYANSSDDELTFGYQEPFAELRYGSSLITGLFRSNAVGTLHSWHLSQVLSGFTHPYLAQDFIEEDPPIDRVIQFPEQPQFLVDILYENRHARCMPVYGVPGMMDHF